MIHSRQVIVDKIKSWIGCKEGDAVHKHIIDTYNAHKPLAQGYKVKYTDAWCATTVSAAAIECGYTDIIPTECSCSRMIKLLQKKGIWQESDAYVPKAGDIIFYDWQDSGVGDNTGVPDHVGIVEKCDGNIIVVIEGNKNDGVERRSIQVNGKYIRGYGTPKYSSESKPVTPKKQEKYGIDISSNQGNVDFNKVKQSGIDFVILRSTTKNNQPDTKFETYYKGATSVGLPVSVYKYSYAKSVAQAQLEAESVVKLLKGRKCEIWLDMEDNSQIPLGKNKIALIITAFLTTCVNAGYDVGIYCNQNWYNNYIKDDIKDICRFWIARYGTNNGIADNQYKPNGKGVVMWQYTSKGKVNGISGNVDMDIKFG